MLLVGLSCCSCFCLGCGVVRFVGGVGLYSVALLFGMLPQWFLSAHGFVVCALKSFTVPGDGVSRQLGVLGFVNSYIKSRMPRGIAFVDLHSALKYFEQLVALCSSWRSFSS